ncbi:aminodeoxychorismate lyase [Bacillus massiliigorillae]|uniref:aminodeoxychorismate lyase n=1 Tax=Bacillus massiliigorillae TaxID=1243664 RepID=UPI0003A6D010|nr:aminodeoxychorismate lyase [Bacillus massiliigorillae]
MIIYQNGQYLDEEKVMISPFDHGFLYGIGLFETLRLYDGHAFLLDDHIERLQQGLREMFIEVTIQKEEMKQILLQLLMKNDLKHARVRINVSAGVGVVGLPNQPYREPNIMVFISPLQEPLDTLQEKSAVLLQVARNTPETSVRLKSHHYGNNIAAKMELKNYPEAEGIFLTKEGYVSEAITSNVFLVKRDVLYTPHICTGILPGITRRLIIRMAEKIGLQVQEGYYRVEELEQADEVFITNSIQEIVAVNELVGKARYQGATGSVTNQLFSMYKEYRNQLETSQTLR